MLSFWLWGFICGQGVGKFKPTFPSGISTLLQVSQGLDNHRLRLQAASSWGPQPVAHPLPVAISPQRHGEWWLDPQQQTRHWSLQLESPGALSLGLNLDRFQLPPGAELYLRGFHGAVRRALDRGSGVLATWPLGGDRLQLEYIEPYDSQGLQLLISQVTKRD